MQHDVQVVNYGPIQSGIDGKDWFSVRSNQDILVSSIFSSKWSLIAPKNQDGGSHNAKRKASNGSPQTNQWRHSGFRLGGDLRRCSGYFRGDM